MNPDQIIASVNRENKQLQDEVASLRSSNIDLNARVNFYKKVAENQAYTIYEANAHTGLLLQQIEVLKGQIAFIERKSTAEATASARSIEFLQQKLHAMEASNQLSSYNAEALSQHTVRLREEVARLHRHSSKTEAEVREYWSQIFHLESESLINMVRHQNSKDTLSKMKTNFQDLSDEYHKLVEARDDLNRRLARSNDSLHQVNKRDKRALTAAKSSNRELLDKLEEAEKKLLENDELRDSFREQIANEERLQQEIQQSLDENTSLQRSLDYFRGEDTKQQNAISSLQNQMKKLDSAERAEGFRATIRHKTVEIEKLTEQLGKQEETVKQKERLITELFSKIKANTALVEEKEAHVAGWKGNALAHSLNSLDQIMADRVSIGIDITTIVFKLLKGINSRQKADEAVSAIQAFLAKSEKRMNYAAKTMNQTKNDIESLIADVRGLVNNKGAK